MITRKKQSGFATVTALFMVVVAVMLVTAYASLVQSAVGSASAMNYERKALAAAMAGIHHAAGYLVDDVVPVDMGIILTEIHAQAAPHIYISEIAIDSGGNVLHDFIELYNPSQETVSLRGWTVQIGTAILPGVGINPSDTIALGDTIAPGGYYLITRVDSGNIPVKADTEYSFTTAIGINSWVALIRPPTLGDSRIVTAEDTWTYTQGPIWYKTVDFVGMGASPWFKGPSSALGISGKSLERKASRTSTETTLAGGGSEATAGNAYDTESNGGARDSDFVHQNRPRPQNRHSAREYPPGSLENLDRRYEFIEIQNTDSVILDLDVLDYWISVGDPSAGNKRYLSGLPTVDTLGAWEIGVIVPYDADTVYIASLSNLACTQVKWFQLGNTTGTQRDSFLALNEIIQLHQTLKDRVETVTIGQGAGGYGLIYGDSINPTMDTYSRQKIRYNIREDNTSPWDTFAGTNWETTTATPGVTRLTGAIDGAVDSWYAMNGEDYYDLDSSAYYRVRIFDEAGKVNLNIAEDATIEGGLAADMLVSRMQGASPIRGNAPNPPFSTADHTTSLTAGERFDFMTNVHINGKGNTDSSRAELLTPASANTQMRLAKMQYFLPFYTPYGYTERDAWKININMAESPVLRAGILSTCSPTLSAAACQILGDKIYNYLTNPLSPTTADSNPHNDVAFHDISQIPTKTTGLTATEINALNTNMSALKRMFRVNSTGYFTIYATGFVFARGANLNTDTPLARTQIFAVLYRNNEKREGKIVYWRELSSDESFRAPIGRVGRRYPSFLKAGGIGWDPDF